MTDLPAGIEDVIGLLRERTAQIATHVSYLGRASVAVFEQLDEIAHDESDLLYDEMMRAWGAKDLRSELQALLADLMAAIGESDGYGVPSWLRGA